MSSNVEVKYTKNGTPVYGRKDTATIVPAGATGSGGQSSGDVVIGSEQQAKITKTEFLGGGKRLLYYEDGTIQETLTTDEGTTTTRVYKDATQREEFIRALSEEQAKAQQSRITKVDAPAAKRRDFVSMVEKPYDEFTGANIDRLPGLPEGKPVTDISRYAPPKAPTIRERLLGRSREEKEKVIDYKTAVKEEQKRTGITAGEMLTSRQGKEELITMGAIIASSITLPGGSGGFLKAAQWGQSAAQFGVGASVVPEVFKRASIEGLPQLKPGDKGYYDAGQAQFSAMPEEQAFYTQDKNFKEIMQRGFGAQAGAYGKREFNFDYGDKSYKIEMPTLKGLVTQIPGAPLLMPRSEAAFKSEVTRAYQAQGLTGADLNNAVSAAMRQRKAGLYGEVAGVFAANVASEAVGQRFVSGAFKSVGKIPAKTAGSKIFGKAFFEIGKAGVLEGAASEIAQQRARYENVNYKKVAGAGAIGGVSAGLLGGGIAATALNKPGISKILTGVGYIGDVYEFPADITEKAISKGFSRAFDIKVLTPVIIPEVSASVTLGVMEEGGKKSKLPREERPAGIPKEPQGKYKKRVLTAIETFIDVPEIPAPIPPQPIKPVPTPTGTSVLTDVTIPIDTDIPVPVPIPDITETETPIETMINTNVGVPVGININTLVPRVWALPPIPLDLGLGGGAGGGFRKGKALKFVNELSIGGKFLGEFGLGKPITPFKIEAFAPKKPKKKKKEKTKGKKKKAAAPPGIDIFADIQRAFRGF